METPQVSQTPKRKRSQMGDDAPSLNTNLLSFNPILHPEGDDAGSISPRTKVAHRFQGLSLALESGGGVSRVACGDSRATAGTSQLPRPPIEEANGLPRKRVKMPDAVMTDDESDRFLASPEHNFQETLPPGGSAGDAVLTPETVIASVELDSLGKQRGIGSQPSPPESPTRSTGGNSLGRSRKRAGTPPLITKTNPSSRTATEAEEEEGLAGDDERMITDPLRASLTWHEDEITIYDPDDSDDDGTGINGIGFKPTPAMQYARTLKRKKQLAEYRKREEQEARVKRSQRRQGKCIASGRVELKTKTESRRVRFLEDATTQLIGI